MNMKTKEITMIGLMAALTCIAGPLSLPLPFSPVPISLTNLAVYFAVYLLGMKRGTISYCVYLLLGLVGMPVFSAFTSGPAKILGPTGGYLIGFVLWQSSAAGLSTGGMGNLCQALSVWWQEQQCAMPLEQRGLPFRQK